MPRPAKRLKLLDDDDNDGDQNGDRGNAFTNGDSAEFKINSEYARRFEHNKKREELHRLEEKFRDDDSDSEDSEDEDDAGELITNELDSEINATIQALRNKDPRIYNTETTFFRPIEDEGQAVTRKEKPMHLSDYHRQNLLRAANGEAEDQDEVVPQTYSQEQDAIRRQLVSEMHGSAETALANQDEVEDDFMIKKSKPVHEGMKVTETKKSKKAGLDIEKADEDPEAYLNDFFAARAWVPDETSRFAHLDSDDSEDDARADGFEEAYNMRFEDPETANAKLMSYARDTQKFSARREEKSGRQKQRERERELKEAAKHERHEEKKRLRRLRVEEMEKKVAQIKEAAGLGPGEVVNVDEWRTVLEGEFDDNQWETEMQRRFGDKYYSEKDKFEEDGMSDGPVDAHKNKGGKIRKPKWDDDIDIKDIIPEFVDEEETEKPVFTLTDDEVDAEDDPTSSKVIQAGPTDGEASDAAAAANGKSKSRKDLQAEARSAKRRQRMAIEELVDASLTTDHQPGPSSSSKAAAFRYRETSPTNFGLSARDILFADDTALNTFAGLKKTHAFRDADKKARDRKKLGKKARLREWRRETFGHEDGFRGSFAEYVQAKTGEQGGEEMAGGQQEGERKRKRKGKGTKSQGGMAA